MSQEQLETLNAAIASDRAPFCSGILKPPIQSFTLYFGVEGNTHRINLASASPEALQKLSAACEAATFGIGGKNVLDESYRKAGKLDNIDFATLFDPNRLGLIEIIRSHLLEGHEEKRSIDVELYKLNVYGEGSFFKAHRDTPRAANMFGSLVVVFPTPHEGGEFMLRHQGQEWKVDPSNLMFPDDATTSGESEIEGPPMSYIAFYSDVEHEVLKVTSGSRVTITYNLYFSKTAPPPVIATPSASDDTHLSSALKKLLCDPTFLPDGGKLGFGLSHQYPINKETNFAELIKCLKGADAILYKASRYLGLAASLWMVYTRKCSPWVMADKVLDLDEPHYYGGDQDATEALIEERGCIPITCTVGSWGVTPPNQGHEIYETITWVTDPTKLNERKDLVLTYGNEVTIDYVYGDPCLFVSVKPFNRRAIADFVSGREMV